MTLQDSGSCYEIVLLANGPDTLSHKIAEVFDDCVVIEELPGVNQTRVPIYAIKSVRVTTLPGKK